MSVYISPYVVSQIVSINPSTTVSEHNYMLYCFVKNKQTMRVCRKPTGVIQGLNRHTIGILVIYLKKLQVESRSTTVILQGRLQGIFRDTIEIL